MSATGMLASSRVPSPLRDPGSLPAVAPSAAPEGRAPIERPASSRAPRFLHVVEPGAMVRLAGGRLRVTKKDSVLLEVPLIKLQGVVLYGAAQISSPCVRALLGQGVWLGFFTRSGRFQGRLQPARQGGGALRRRQWERSRDPVAALEFGRAVVRGKILGQRLVAAAYARNYPAETLGEGQRVLAYCLDRIAGARNLDELRGLEGTASRAYYGLFRRCNRSGFAFPGRMRPADCDPINALLNLGYSLLTRELEGLIEATGLDPTIGLYHLPHGDRPSLACDWVEEFRHPVVDRLVLHLINRGTIRPEDFEDRGERGLRLSAEGLRKFLAAWEQVMNGSAEPGAGSQTDGVRSPAGFRGVMLAQLGRLLDFLDRGAPYRTWLEA